MSKAKVPLFKAPLKCATVETDATIGATVGVNLFWPDGTVVVEADFNPAPADTGNVGGISRTLWSLVLEIPANVTALENATGTGLFAVTGAGSGAFRTITPVAGETTVANGDGVTGNPTLGLADVTATAGGTLQKYGFDAKGRRSQEEAATTDDLDEGTTNLYFTNARADARIELQKGVAGGLATLDGSAKLDAGQLPALAITETFVVADQAAMLALTAQQGDVAVRTDESTSYILTAEPASTLANWQELLSPTAGAVTSFNGRTGAVVPATGDYTAAQVGADPAGAAAAIVAATITNGDTTHAPSGDAVFDALAGKAQKSDVDAAGIPTPVLLTDAYAVSTSGFYTAGFSSANAPDTSQWEMLFVERGADSGTLLASRAVVGAGGVQAHINAKSGGTFGGWNQLIHSGTFSNGATISDANLATVAGNYYAPAGTANSPTVGQNFTISVAIGANANNLTQMAISVDAASDTYVRARSFGTWHAWHML